MFDKITRISGMALAMMLAGGASAPAQEALPPTVGAAEPEPARFEVVGGYLVAHLPAEQVTVVAQVAPDGQAPRKSEQGQDQGWATWTQRGDLLWRGQMEDSQGRTYNVRILPGYVAPANHLVAGWADAGSALGEYGQARSWNRGVHRMRSSLRWGWEDSLWEFGLEGSGKAWGKHFDAARQRTARKTFGWPLAYPWALISSTFETLVRVPLGALGAAAGTAVGVVGVPVTHVAWPAAKAAYHVGVDGVLLPVSGWAWQTLAAPPASLFASAPTPARADGTWMKMTDPKATRTLAAPRPEPVLGAGALATLVSYGRETALLEAQEQELKGQEQAALAAVRARFAGEQKALAEARAQRLRAWAEEPGHRAELQALLREGGDAASLRAVRTALEQGLVNTGLSREQAEAAVRHLIAHPLREHAPVRPQPAAADKTDPVRGALATVDAVTGVRLAKP